ncbi:glycosyltransferase family 2 protein [Hydrotalea sp.]|uniref:glycosyltransferase family 2 protein n=1 Tax=Hydrotalea sp. TaxID=2881279 RepID=UPI003D14ADE0
MISYILIIISAILTLLYAALILLYRKWFLQLRLFNFNPLFIPTTQFSIIIPARNEAANIGSCLQSITQQNYPQHLFEVIVIDDFSTDETSSIVEQWQQQYSNIRLMPLANEVPTEHNSYKKWAIEKAIEKANGTWIVTTDADCIANANWLHSLAQCIEEKKPVLVVAPVSFIYHPTLLGIFQYLDFLSLQGITAASVSAGIHSMCNGANLAYLKSAFYTVNGFKGINHIASGDDMLLMNKIKQHFPNSIAYLFHPNAIVLTQPVFSWKEFFNQRIRWASKADKYDDKSIFWVLVLVYLYNFMLLVLPILALVFLSWPLLICWIVCVLIKTIAELSFMRPVSRFFGSQHLKWFPWLQPLHITYTVIAGWLGKFGHYEWKGRRVV